MSLEKSAGAVIVSMYHPMQYRAPGGRRRSEHARREYLLLRYEAGHWDFPKGHLEGNEQPEDAARREIEEETGLRVRKFLPGFRIHLKYWLWTHPKMSNVKPFDAARGKPKRSLKIVTFFLAEAASRDVRLSWEHTGYAWLPFKDAVKTATYGNAKELLRKAETFFRQGGASQERKVQ